MLASPSASQTVEAHNASLQFEFSNLAGDDEASVEPGNLPNPSPGKRPTYWLTRFVILRLLGIVYAIAFLVAANQIVPFDIAAVYV